MKVPFHSSDQYTDPLNPFLKRGGILLLKVSLQSPFKSKIPPFLGRDLGDPCIEGVKIGKSIIWAMTFDANTLCFWEDFLILYYSYAST